MRDFRDLTISAKAGIREAMEVIDRGAAEIALVATTDGRLAGTVTDGDIRRAILRGLVMDHPIEEVMNSSFTSVGAEASPGEVRSLMRARGIKQVPVVRPDGTLLGVHLLRDLLEAPQHPDNWVVVMAGGRGRRLMPLTEEVPKPMLRVGGQPLLERTIQHVVEHGFQRIFLSVGYLGDQIEEHFGDGSRVGCRIDYLREDTPLGTGGALTLLPEHPTSPLLVVNGDLITDVNFSALADYHTQSGFPATVCVKEFNYQVPYGVCQVDDRMLLGVEEKPMQRFLINAGIYVLDPATLGLVPPGTFFDLPQLIAAIREEGGDIGAFPIRETWIDIGRREDYDRVLQEAMGEQA